MFNQSRNTAYKLKKYVNWICGHICNIFMIFTAILVYIFINSNYEFYVFSTCAISLGIIIGFIYINIIRNKIVYNGRNNLNRLYFLSIMIAIVIGIIIAMLKDKNNINYVFLLLSFKATLEYCEIENIFNIKNKYIRNILIHLVYLFLCTIIFFINEKGYENFSLSNINYQNIYIIISIFISLCMALSTINKILIHRENFSTDEFMKIIYYMCCIIINLSGYLFIKINMKEVAIILLVIKCISFVKFYHYVIDKIRDEYFNIINYNIEEAVNRKKELNVVLIKRNKILNDTNTMINKAQNNYNILLDSIYGAVCLFTNNKLEYINNSMINKFNIESNKLINTDITIFLKKYFDVILEKNESERSYPFEICIDKKSEGYRIFLIYPNRNNKLLYIEDLNIKNENKKLKKEFKEFLEYDKQKKEFFANISHELKTPINLISSALQINKMYMRENNTEAVDKNRKIIMNNCLRLIRTINNFIDANKVSEGYVTPDIKVYNIVEIVENTALGCTNDIEMFNNKLIFDSEEEEIYVRCDKELITRIILNLLSNAIKYGKEYGIINVDLCIEYDKVCIKIKNDSPRIDEDIVPYIFDKFTKVNKAFNRIKEGSGLGLFLTKELVELQGGTIDLISENKGNEFIIRFDYIKDVNEEEICYENFEMNSIEEKVKIEFSDIYTL